MNSMKCWSCALKHLAGALSYGKEVLSGHTYGAELDHRPDLIGELVNCEHHAELLNSTLFDVVTGIRKKLQDHHGICTPDDLDAIRALYLTTERMESTATKEEQQAIDKEISAIGSQYQSVTPLQQVLKKSLDDYPGNPEILDLVITLITDQEQFEFQYQSVQQHANGYRRIIAVRPLCSLDQYTDVIVTQHSLYQLCQSTELSDVFICMNGHQAFLHDYSLQRLPPTYAQRILPSFQTTRTKLKQIYEAASDYDSFMPQPIDKALFARYMTDTAMDFPLSYYFAYKKENRIYDTKMLGSYIDRPICCSTRATLRHLPIVTWQGTAQFINVRTFATDQKLIQLS